MPKKEDQLEERIWSELQKQFEGFFSLYDTAKGSSDVQSIVRVNQMLTEDRDLMVAYLTLAAQRRAERSNFKLTLAVVLISIAAAAGTVVQALVATHVLG